MNANTLLEGLCSIPLFEGWNLTPVNGNKAPYRKNWQTEPRLDHLVLEEEIKLGRAKGYGLRTGEASFYRGGYLLAVDFDGPSAWDKYRELSGGEDPPETVAWTSGKPGREQRLFCVRLPYGSKVSYVGRLKNRVAFKTGVIGPDGKEEQLELRYNHCQSVLPPSQHPETGQYQWITPPLILKGFTEDPEVSHVASAPQWMIDALLFPPAATCRKDQEPELTYVYEEIPVEFTGKTERDRALDYLAALDPHRVDDYDTWIRVGMSLHSLGDDSLLSVWDSWSSQSAKYKPGECEYKWSSFKSNGISLGTLAHLAEQDSPKPVATATRSEETPTPAPAKQGKQLKKRSKEDKAEEPLDWVTRYRMALKGIQAATDAITRKLKIAETCANFRIAKKDVEDHLLLMFAPQRQALTLNLADFLDSADEALEWVIPGLVPKGEILLLSALPKVGKSLLAYDMAYSVADGSRLWGELGELCPQGKILIIQCDESPRSTKVRLSRRGFDPARHQVRIMTNFDIEDPHPLEEELEKYQPDLVIIDSLKAISAETALSENSAEYGNAIYKLRNLLSSHNVGCILIHHDNKGAQGDVTTVRGSTSITGAVWGIAQLKRQNPKDTKDPKRLLTLTPRDGESMSWQLELQNDEDGWRWISHGETSDPNPKQSRTLADRVLDVLRKGWKFMTSAELEIETGIGDGIRKVLSRLVEKRQITRARKGPINPNTNKQQWVYYLPEMEGLDLSQEQSVATPLQTETTPDTPSLGSLACPQGVSSVTETHEPASNPDRESTVTPLTPPVDTKGPEPSQDKHCDSLDGTDPTLPTQCYWEGIRVRAKAKTTDKTKRDGITVPPPAGRQPSPHGVWILFDGDTDPRWVLRPNVWRCGC